MIEYRFKEKPSKDVKRGMFLRFLRGKNVMHSFLKEGNKFHHTRYDYKSYCDYVIENIDSEAIQRTKSFCSWQGTDDGFAHWLEISVEWRMVYLYNMWKFLNDNERLDVFMNMERSNPAYRQKNWKKYISPEMYSFIQKWKHLLIKVSSKFI